MGRIIGVLILIIVCLFIFANFFTLPNQLPELSPGEASGRTEDAIEDDPTRIAEVVTSGRPQFPGDIKHLPGSLAIDPEKVEMVAGSTTILNVKAAYVLEDYSYLDSILGLEPTRSVEQALLANVRIKYGVTLSDDSRNSIHWSSQEDGTLLGRATYTVYPSSVEIRIWPTQIDITDKWSPPWLLRQYELTEAERHQIITTLIQGVEAKAETYICAEIVPDMLEGNVTIRNSDGEETTVDEPLFPHKAAAEAMGPFLQNLIVGELYQSYGESDVDPPDSVQVEITYKYDCNFNGNFRSQLTEEVHP
ncbi:MAG: hypothetical protein ACOCXQ_00100 [Patescibacteria group bacterium]